MVIKIKEYYKLLNEQEFHYTEAILWSQKKFWNTEIGNYPNYDRYVEINSLLREYTEKYTILCWFISLYYHLRHPVDNNKYRYIPNESERLNRNAF